MKTAFHNVGKLNKRDATEYKLKHFSLGTFYSKETSRGLILVNDDGERVGYLRPVGGESKVSVYITWCDGDKTYPCFQAKDRDGTLIPDEYDVTYAYEYDDSERQSQSRSESGGGKASSDRW